MRSKLTFAALPPTNTARRGSGAQNLSSTTFTHSCAGKALYYSLPRRRPHRDLLQCRRARNPADRENHLFAGSDGSGEHFNVNSKQALFLDHLRGQGSLMGDTDLRPDLADCIPQASTLAVSAPSRWSTTLACLPTTKGPRRDPRRPNAWRRAETCACKNNHVVHQPSATPPCCRWCRAKHYRSPPSKSWVGGLQGCVNGVPAS